MLRFGLFGCGRIGRVHAESIASNPRAERAIPRTRSNPPLSDPRTPAAAPYLPVAGIGMSYQTAFVPLLGTFLSGIERPDDPIAPTFHDGVLNSRWLDAALTAATTGTWQKLGEG